MPETKKRFEKSVAIVKKAMVRAKVAETVEEVCELVEAGFEHVTDIDQKKIFRKRK